ncbi:hypothetical protein ADICYQ_0372 [Cyclobacterium qasimii M12-11B]|uniref:Uncharacterized protein n=1 Tax=Cyclobacterium qasimii M12-11B TaxID=641524 RepID=S7VMN5_9BACT|nr:hypothetical protein ADICYQ_0372 [Cyclobacterium qasimii M12-11B]
MRILSSVQRILMVDEFEENLIDTPAEFLERDQTAGLTSFLA